MNIRVTRFLFVFVFVFVFAGVHTERQDVDTEVVFVARATSAIAQTNPVVSSPLAVTEVASLPAKKEIFEEKKDLPKPVSVAKRSLLEIPKLTVNAPVRTMGLDGGKMAVPNNYTEVGLYGLGTVPGEVGNAVMGAHVDNGGVHPTITGVFKNLSSLVAGDEVKVYSETGERIRFVVETTKIYPYNLTNTQEVFGSDGRSPLVLITCHGSWLPGAGTYDERFVVYAVKAS